MTRLRLCVLALFLLPALSWGAVTFDATATCSTGASASTGCAVPLAVASATDRYLVCSVCLRDQTTTVSSLTYGGQALSLGARVLSGSAETLSSELWTLLAPDVGTDTLTLTLSASDTAALSCTSVNGVDQGDPSGTLASANPTGFSFNMTLDVASTDEDMVLDQVCLRNLATNISAGAGQAKRSERATTQGSTNVTLFTSTEVATGAATVMTWTWNSSEHKITQAIPLHPSGGGGGTPPAADAGAYADAQLSSPCVGTYDVTDRDCSAAAGTANGYPTIGGCIAAMASATTCYVRPGTYREKVSNILPAGVSSSQMTTLTTLPGEERLAILECDAAASSTPGIGTLMFTIAGPSKQFIKVANLVLDGNGLGVGSHLGCPTMLISEARFITVEGMEIRQSRNNGLLVNSTSGGRADDNGTDVTITNTWFHHNAISRIDDGTELSHGAYFGSARAVCRHCTFSDNAAYGLHIYHGGGAGNDDQICEWCYVHTNNSRTNGCSAATGSGTRNLLANSVVVGNKCGALFIGAGNTIYSSVLYGNALAGVQGNGSGTVINSISAANGTPYLNNGGTITLVTSIGSLPGFRDAATLDFNLLSTDVAALQQGTDRRTTCPTNNRGPVTCNFATAGGLRPNLGPFNELQRPLSSVLVGRTMTDATSLLLTASMPVTGRVTACTPARFTVLGSTTVPAGTTPTACTIVGNGTQLDLTVTPTFVTGETITVTAAYGAIEGVRIGSDMDYLPERSWEGTALSVVNAIGAAPSAAVLTQTACAWYEPSGTEAGAPPLVSGGATVALTPSGGAVLRCKIAGTVADQAAFSPRLFCRNNAESYAAASTSCQPSGICVNLALAPQLAHGQATTERLASQHATNVAGSVSSTGTFALWDPVQNSEGEFVTAVQVGSTASGTFDCRLEQAPGTDFDAYTTLSNGLAAPQVTVEGGGVAGTTLRLYGL